jgi:hypothetical protein
MNGGIPMSLMKMTMDKHPWTHRCKLCGQYIVEGEEAYIVYPPPNDKGITWGIVHSVELDAISEGLTDAEKLEKLRGNKMPRFKGFTSEQNKNSEIFKSVMKNRHYWDFTLSGRTLKAHQRGTSLIFEYDMILERISGDHRGRRGMFDGIFLRQAETEIQNEIEKLQGKENPCKIETAQSAINEVVKEVNKFFK